MPLFIFVSTQSHWQSSFVTYSIKKAFQTKINQSPFFFSKMKDAGTWPKNLAYTKCADFTAKDPIVRPNIDLREAMKTVIKKGFL
jgi:hypothetical protein